MKPLNFSMNKNKTKTRKRKWVKTINTPIFIVKVHICIGRSLKDAAGRHPNQPENMDDFEAFVDRTQPNEAWVFLEKDTQVDIIAHECLHVAHHILANVGVEPSYYNDETVCYLLGYLIEETLGFMMEIDAG